MVFEIELYVFNESHTTEDAFSNVLNFTNRPSMSYNQLVFIQNAGL